MAVIRLMKRFSRAISVHEEDDVFTICQPLEVICRAFLINRCKFAQRCRGFLLNAGCNFEI